MIFTTVHFKPDSGDKMNADSVPPYRFFSLLFFASQVGNSHQCVILGYVGNSHQCVILGYITSSHYFYPSNKGKLTIYTDKLPPIQMTKDI